MHESSAASRAVECLHMSHPIVDAQTERLTAAEAALAAAEARERDLQQRLVALVTASGTLFGSPDLADMMPAVVVLARTLLPADGYAVWRHDHESGTWHIGASSRSEERRVGQASGV